MSPFELDTFVDIPDDDDMPPLVERPPQMSMMTYSFDTDFTPIPYSPDFLDVDMAPEPVSRFELISEEDAAPITATKPSHAKKRDAGHIPRPPNAFILFRSSFIKSESVPGNIEGNHSTLSKIIGIVWKTLPPAERELWEKRAIQAQAEHRARYPDWRFRPGTNVDALAKRKTKDKNKDRPPARRRRNPSARDNGIATGGGRCKARGVMQERRCAQIAELLARGVKGVALTSAVQAWDKETGVSGATDGVFVAEQGVVGSGEAKATRTKAGRAQQDGAGRGRREMRNAKSAETTATIKTRSASSVQQARFNIPLTSMYRRASSVPLVPEHGSNTQDAAVAINGISTVPDFCPPPLSPASSVSYGSEVSFPESDNMNVPPMFDFVPLSPPDSPCSSHMDNNDLGSLVGPGRPTLGIGSTGAPPPGQGPEDFFSSYSTLCGWAGNIAGVSDDPAKVVLPSLSPPYGCPGEMDHPFSFLSASPAVADPDPWNNYQDIIARPTFGGLEDTWAGARVVVAPFA